MGLLDLLKKELRVSHRLRSARRIAVYVKAFGLRQRSYQRRLAHTPYPRQPNNRHPFPSLSKPVEPKATDYHENRFLRIS
jgi:hypothetical protein